MTLATDTDAIINSALRYFEDASGNWATPGEMAASLDPTTVQTPALDAIDAALVDVANGDCERLILSMPPQEGKSQRTSRWFPLWMLHRNPNLRIAIVSFEHGIATRWGRLIREGVMSHLELGLTLDPSTRAKHDWALLGAGGSVYCCGINGSLTSRPVDLLIIDDPYKNAEQADSSAWQTTVRDFWTEVALPRLGAGAPVVIIQTRWRDDDMAGWLAEEGDGWRVINIPAQADHDPEKGETDILGRQPGEYMLSARGRKLTDWEKKKREVGSRSWNALYQGRPAPDSGNILQRAWWQFYNEPLHFERDDGTCVVTQFDDMLTSWDLTFKDTDSSDYVVGQVWMRRGSNIYLLDQVRGRMDFPTTLAAVERLAVRWPQSLLKLIEDKANGPAVIASLSRTVPGIVPEEPHGSKVARTQAVSPLVEGKNVWLPNPKRDGNAWVYGFIDEAAMFPNGAHDDQVDTFSQAANRLILTPLLAGGEIVDDHDLYADLDTAISPY
jgi:predicted phage terminase large subunit-like protein